MQDKNFSWVAALITLILVALVSTGSAGATQRFTDPVGDASGGPDVKAVSISDRKGVITFTYLVPHLLPTAASGQVAGGVLTEIDTNRDGKVEYDLYFEKGSDGFHWAVSKRPSDKLIPLTAQMRHVASGDTYSFTLGSSDLGGTLGFAFATSTATFDEGGNFTAADSAPDSGTWSYDLISVKPVIGAPTASPKAPAAGKPFTVTIPVTRSDTGDGLTPLQGAKLTIDPTIAGVAVKHVDTLKNGSARLHLTVPPKTTGKVLRVNVEVDLGTQSTHTVTSWKIA